MELLEKVKDIISDQNEWFVIKVEQPNVPHEDYIKSVFGSVISSNHSISGIKNYDFFKRWILGGFHVTYNNGNTGVLIMFCQVKKPLDQKFQRYFIMRYHYSLKQSIPVVALSHIKPSEEMTTYVLMNIYLNSEIEKVFESGNIPRPVVRVFGNCSKSSKNFNK